ncbi:MAG: hypothetical protein KC736_03640 [Candidatus Moranbacteria bacterium]|nr:hypothetical protein [Candidatus Moranbacteria bacterium]
MKKAIILTPVFALAFAVVAPVSADYNRQNDRNDRNNGSKIVVTSENNSDTNVDATATANSGRNTSDNNRRTGHVTTGDAIADNLVDVRVNNSEVDVTVPASRNNTDAAVHSTNNTDTDVDADANANSGNNTADNNGSDSRYSRHSHQTTNGGHGTVETGSARAVNSVYTLENSSVVRVR